MRDTRLKRDVAIKFLPSDRGDARRFEQEARAVAALNHPNIISIYDVGETGKFRGGPPRGFAKVAQFSQLPKITDAGSNRQCRTSIGGGFRPVSCLNFSTVTGSNKNRPNRR